MPPSANKINIDLFIELFDFNWNFSIFVLKEKKRKTRPPLCLLDTDRAKPSSSRGKCEGGWKCSFNATHQAQPTPGGTVLYCQEPFG
jgi:hypothetical protein